MHRRDLLIGAAAATTALTTKAWAADGGLKQAARDAFIYTLPMVEIANVRSRSLGQGLKAGHLFPQRSLATPQARNVTTPNNDTVYSTAFIDLSNGPATLTVPPLGDRYASFAIMDMFSDNIAVLGTRTTGPDGGTFTLVGPTGAASVDAIRSPTPWVWALARIIVDGPNDLEAARAVQARFKVEAAAAGTPAPGANRNGPWADYFKAASALMLENPPPATDTGILRRMAPLGLGAAGFDPAHFSPAEQAEILAGVDEGRTMIRSAKLGAKVEGGWIYQSADTGNFFQDYPGRARIALAGLAALPPAEAMYLNALAPDGRAIFDGDGLWRLSFPAGQTPPVNAFWSLTMYEETPDGQFFLTENPINRYAIGDRTPGLVKGADGGLDLWMSRTDPGGARSANWLPAPAKGPFSLFLRAYLPKAEMMSHAYIPPAIIKA
jgi:hypothetical protein